MTSQPYRQPDGQEPPHCIADAIAKAEA